MRTMTSPLAATFQLALVGIGVPAALSIRLQQEVLPLQPADTLLLFGAFVWLVIARALLTRGDAVDSRTTGRGSPLWQAHRLVDESLFGVGMVDRNQPTVTGLQLVAKPAITITNQLPLPAASPRVGSIAAHAALPDADNPRPIPVIATVLSDLEADVDPIAAWETQEYTVARGDTFWSIAEAILDDGRLWTNLHELNFGREVAPGILLNDGDELRIGWSILIPKRALEVGAETDDAVV